MVVTRILFLHRNGISVCRSIPVIYIKKLVVITAVLMLMLITDIKQRSERIIVTQKNGRGKLTVYSILNINESMHHVTRDNIKGTITISEHQIAGVSFDTIQNSVSVNDVEKANVTKKWIPAVIRNPQNTSSYLHGFDSSKFNMLTRASNPIKGLPSLNISRSSKYLSSQGTQNKTGGNPLVFFPESKRMDFPLSVLPYPYYINNRHICQTAKNLTLLVIVISATPNFSRRRSIRATWGNSTFFKSYEFRVIFMLGRTKNESVQTQIEKENNVYKDIVQGNFIDTYHNLTHKAVLGLRWVSENCLKSKMIAKVDDDMFVNMQMLLRNTEREYRNKSKEIFCYARAKGQSFIQRNPTDKWMLRKEYFKNMTHFPFPHCNGFFVLFTPDVITKLYNTAKTTPFLWLDDVYLTGILPEIIGGVKITSLYLGYYEDVGLECFMSKSKRCDLLGVITFTDGMIDKMMNFAIENYKISA